MWLTYIIEKGEHCQAAWLIFGFREAPVFVRIVVDDVELEEKVEIKIRFGGNMICSLHGKLI